jgi:hypothetical protein
MAKSIEYCHQEINKIASNYNEIRKNFCAFIKNIEQSIASINMASDAEYHKHVEIIKETPDDENICFRFMNKLINISFNVELTHERSLFGSIIFDELKKDFCNKDKKVKVKTISSISFNKEGNTIKLGDEDLCGLNIADPEKAKEIFLNWLYVFIVKPAIDGSRGECKE